MMKAASKASKQGKVKNSIHDKTFTPRAAAAACMQILDIEETDHCMLNLAAARQRVVRRRLLTTLN